MNCSEAVRPATEIKPRIVIRMHYAMSAHNTVDPEVSLATARDGGVKAMVVIIEHMGCYVCWPF